MAFSKHGPYDPSEKPSTPPPILPKFPSFFRRKRRVPLIFTLPLTFLILYLLLPQYIPHPEIFTKSPSYLSHAGKSALETTITLPKMQFPFEKGTGGDDERREMVLQTMRRTWELYAREAWTWDEVRPVHGGGRDTRSGLCFVVNVGMRGVPLLWMV